MKILHIEDYFVPVAGYQINILPKYQVKQGHDVYILSASIDSVNKSTTKFFQGIDWDEEDRKYCEQTGVKLIRVPTKIHKLVASRIVQSGEFYRKIKEVNPEVVYMHGNDTLTGIIVTKISQGKNWTLICDSHMVDMASKNRLNRLFHSYYKKFITPILVKNSIPVIRTQNTTYVERALGVPISQCPWISVGSDTMLFHPVSKDEKTELRKKYNIPSDWFVCVFTGKLDGIRGSEILAEAAATLKNEKIGFVTVGGATDEAGRKSLEMLEKLPNVRTFPTQKYFDLPSFYQLADIGVFPKRCSLSFYDAQACGLPIVAEDNDISSDRLKYDNGLTYRSGDIEDFISKIKYMTRMDRDELEKMGNRAKEVTFSGYNYKNLADKYEVSLRA